MRYGKNPAASCQAASSCFHLAGTQRTTVVPVKRRIQNGPKFNVATENDPVEIVDFFIENGDSIVDL